jgi:spore germination cell wall hydrolase CwlJ-like protein
MTERSVGEFFPFLFKNLVAVSFMLFGLYGCYKMLVWAVDHSRSRAEYSAPLAVTTASQREKQLDCLARNIYYEAGNEPFEGKVAVAQVTLNRADSGQFPSDICKVVYQKNIFYEKTVCQFSWYCDRSARVRPLHSESYQESMLVAKKVLLEGFRLPSLTEAMYYHADYVRPNWRKEKIAQIGRHIFYK